MWMVVISIFRLFVILAIAAFHFLTLSRQTYLIFNLPMCFFEKKHLNASLGRRKCGQGLG
jgi:hypothetical protein